jgi:hypothetical protein
MIEIMLRRNADRTRSEWKDGRTSLHSTRGGSRRKIGRREIRR